MSVRASIAKELHRQARRNFPRRNVVLKGVQDLYQADLVEMQPYASINRGYRYIMTMINCFTKFAFAVPLKNKSAESVVNALRPILTRHKMNNFQTDDGREWFNSKVKTLITKHHINHYSTYSDKKAQIVERFNRTLKMMMWRKFTEQGHYKWLPILDQLVHQYNNTVHRTTGFKPSTINKNNEIEVLLNIAKNSKHNLCTRSKFKVNDKVRISKYKKVFSKGYLPNWTNEIFTIHEIKQTRPPTFIIKDGNGHILKGAFYKEEISKTKQDEVFFVETVLKKRGDKLFVRWKGYDKTHDSWINKSDLVYK